MAIFRHQTDSSLQHRDGEPITVTGPVDPASYDFEDVGPMFHARFADGETVELFADEIQEA